MGEYITSRQNALAAQIKKLADQRAFRRAQGRFLCDGVKLVEEAVKWHAGVEILVVTEGLELPFPMPEGVRLVHVPPELMKYLSTVETPQGVLAVCRTPSLELPETLHPGRYLVLDGLQDPGNVGTIWRTADAFGANGLLLVNGCADPFGHKTVRATMGAAFRLPVWETELPTLKERLSAIGVPLYCTALREDTVDVRQISLASAAVIIGSEGRGVSEQSLALCEKTLKIPMSDRCESLNAASAACVVLWEMVR